MIAVDSFDGFELFFSAFASADPGRLRLDIIKIESIFIDPAYLGGFDLGGSGIDSFFLPPPRKWLRKGKS